MNLYLDPRCAVSDLVTTDFVTMLVLYFEVVHKAPAEESALS